MNPKGGLNKNKTEQFKGMRIFHCHQHTTAGGAAKEDITITGVETTDMAFVTVVDNGTNSVTLLLSACTANTLSVTFSGDPSSDAIINVLILRK